MIDFDQILKVTNDLIKKNLNLDFIITYDDLTYVSDAYSATKTLDLPIEKAGILSNTLDSLNLKFELYIDNTMGNFAIRYEFSYNQIGGGSNGMSVVKRFSSDGELKSTQSR